MKCIMPILKCLMIKLCVRGEGKVSNHNDAVA